MICLSIGSSGSDKVNDALSKCDFTEIRLDLTNLNKDDTVALFGSKKGLMATCRLDNLPLEECKERLLWAITGSRLKRTKALRYIDIEYDAPDEYRQELVAAARNAGFKVVHSYHNNEGTDSYERMEEIYHRAIELGADIVKIVASSKTIQECSRLLNLYKIAERGKLAAFAVGDEGRFTRLLSHFLGSPLIYCTLDEESATAPGQLTISEAQKLISKKYYPHQVSKRRIIERMVAPASKSHAQRAILSAAWAKGRTTLYGYTPCADSEAALKVIRKLGAKVKIEKCRVPRFKVVITSPGINKLSANNLNVGESGLLSRLMAPMAGHILANGQKKITIKGVGSLLNRELFADTSLFEKLGLEIKSKDNRLPITITGEMKATNLELCGKGGSQLLSGLLMALPLCDQSSKIVVREPTSTPYIDLTVKTLKDFEIEVENSDFREFKIAGKQRYKARSFFPIEGDWSGASMLLVAGAITEGISITNLPIGSRQADEMVIDILRGCGVEVNITEHPKYLVMCGDLPCAFTEDESDEEIILGSLIEVEKPKQPLLPFEFDATNAPDLFPSLAVLALNCDGVSKIKGIERLSNKESDRAESIYTEFTKLGGSIEIDGDWMIIEGSKLHGGYCSAHNDHRIAMAIVTAALNIDENVYLDDIECINKSFPNFLKNFKQ